MWDKLINLLKYYSEEGMRLPMAYDKDKPGPSITLLFAHIANAVAIGAVIYLTIQNTKDGAIAAISYSVITMVLYMMRRIISFKANLEKGDIELDSEEKDK